VTGQRYWADSVNVANRAAYVPGLPEDTIVEVPAWVDGEGVHPQRIGALPKALVAVCHTQATIQSLVVESYRTRSRNVLLQALLVDPAVGSVSSAEKLLDHMLVLQKDHLPQFGDARRASPARRGRLRLARDTRSPAAGKSGATHRVRCRLES